MARPFVSDVFFTCVLPSCLSLLLIFLMGVSVPFYHRTHSMWATDVCGSMFNDAFVFSEVMETHCLWVDRYLLDRGYTIFVIIYRHIYLDLDELIGRSIYLGCNQLLEGEASSICNERMGEMVSCVRHAINLEGCEDPSYRR